MTGIERLDGQITVVALRFGVSEGVDRSEVVCMRRRGDTDIGK